MPDYTDWPENFPPVTHFVDEQDNPKPWRILMGHPDYEAAKNHEDLDAAQRLIRHFMDSPWARKCLIQIGRDYPNAIVTSIHAVEAGGKNKIPHELAHYIAQMTGLQVDDSIIQTNIVKRTGNDAIYRLAFRPSFGGPVQPGRPYILVDDVFSNGGSFSELRQYIQQQGGNVVHTAAMTSGGHGNIIALTTQTRLDLERKFGVNSLIDFCKECNLYGGNYKALTEPEAFFLARSPSLDAARDRIAQARQESNRGILPEGIQGPQTPEPGTVIPDPPPNTFHSPESAFDPGIPGNMQASFDFSSPRTANDLDDFIHKTIIKTADKPGIYSVIGKKIPLLSDGSLSKAGWKKLYDALSMYRDKQVETSRYLFIDNTGEISGHLALSFRHPGLSPFSPADFSDYHFMHFISAFMEKNNCSVVFCHNHPSGNPAPSDEDIQLTKYLKDVLGNRFTGHIILDHGKFSVCGNNNEWAQINPGQYGKIQDPLIRHIPESFFGTAINRPGDLTLIRAALRVDGGSKWNDADWIPVVFCNAAAAVTALHYYHVSDFTRPDAQLFLINKTAGIAEMTGSTMAFPVTDLDMMETFRKLNNEIRLFTDFYANGKTLAVDDEHGSVKHYLNKKIVYSDSTFPIPARSPNIHGDSLNAPNVTAASPPKSSKSFSTVQKNLLKWGALNTPALYKSVASLNNDIKNLTQYKKKNAASLKRKKAKLLQKLHAVYARIELEPFEKNLFNASINAVFEETTIQNVRHNLVCFGRAPQILIHAGLPHSSLYMDSGHLYTSMKGEPLVPDGNIKNVNYHGIHPGIIKKIPDSLKKPLLVFQSGHYPASLVAVLDLYDKDNNPIIVPITPFRKSSLDSVEFRYNKISSVYGKRHIDRFIDNHKNMVLYVHENRSRLLLPRERQSLRAALDHFDSGFYEDNILRYKNTVKAYAAKTGVMDPSSLADPQTPYEYQKPAAPRKQLPGNAAPANKKRISPEVIETYTRAVIADSGEIRKNTAANYWHNYRVLCRSHASSPAEAMKIAKDIIRKMPRTEQEKLKSCAASYAKMSRPPESYNRRILRFYEETVKRLSGNKPYARNPYFSSVTHTGESIEKKGTPKKIKKNRTYEDMGY